MKISNLNFKKEKAIICLLFFVSLQILNAQTYSSEKIFLENWGSIYLPSSMEVQAGINKQIVNETKKEFSINAEKIVFQQKGLNDGENKETYARIIIKTVDNTDTFPDLNSSKITEKEINAYDKSYKEQTYEIAKNPKYNAKIGTWNSLKLLSINNKKCLNYSYMRTVGENPETYIEYFIFWRGSIQHSLNIEYRVKDAKIWKEDLENCIKSLQIN